MLVRMTAKRQVTLPAHFLDEMDVSTGDRLQFIEAPDGYLLRPRRIDYSRLGTLRAKIPEDHSSIYIREFREQPYDHGLRR